MNTDDVPVDLPAHGGRAGNDAPPPRVGLVRRLTQRRLYRCAVPGVSLTDYSRSAQAKGWGAPCTQSRTTITLSNGVRLTVASAIARLVLTILNEAIRRGYKIRQADTGAFNCRYISGTRIWSNHAWAIAVDLNWQTNPFTRVLRTDHPTWLRAMFNRYGFAWGGDYSGSKDAMHYEFMGTPSQARTATALALEELTGTKPPATPAGLPVHTPGVRVLEWQDGAEPMAGTDVKAFQDVTNAWYPDLEPLAEDGYFGQRSAQRARYLQERAGLTVDGIVGPATWRALGF